MIRNVLLKGLGEKILLKIIPEIFCDEEIILDSLFCICKEIVKNMLHYLESYIF